MKAFQTIHAVLLLALVIGIPVAATTRLPGEDFSLGRALAQAGGAAAVIVVLLVVNYGVARLLARHRDRKAET